MSKKLIIPVEIKKRELLSVINLSINFLKENWVVYIGQKQQVFPFIKNFSRSVWLLKSIVPGENNILKKLKKNNHFISSLDIEGLVPSNGKYGVLQRYSETGLKLSDLIFFWGKNHFINVKRIFPKFQNKYFVTGSPIIDVWQKKFFHKKNKKKKILFITSFPLANPIGVKLKDESSYLRLSISAFGENLSKKNLKTLKLEYEVQKKALADYQKIFERLVSTNKFDICIRPHPMENPETWKNLISKKCYIDNKSDLNDQILNSDILIHFNSTVSVQSAFNKKKTLTLFNKDYKKFLEVLSDIPLKLSETFYSYENLLKKIKINKKKNNTNLLNKVLFFKKNSNSSNIIFNTINKKFLDDGYIQDPFNFFSILNLMEYIIKRKIGFFLGVLLKYIPFIKNKFDFHLVSSKLGKAKWSKLHKNEIKYLYKSIEKNKKFLSSLKFEKHVSGMYKIYLTK